VEACRAADIRSARTHPPNAPHRRPFRLRGRAASTARVSTVSTSQTRAEARSRARTKDKSDAKKKNKNEALEWIKSIGAAVVLFLIIRTFLVQAYNIPSNSMEKTLLVGDYLMANNAVFGARIPFTGWRVPGFRDPHHGEIVVFRPTYNRPEEDVVKRVIGLPGDTLQGRDGAVYRNGKKLDEPYVQHLGRPDGPINIDGALRLPQPPPRAPADRRQGELSPHARQLGAAGRPRAQLLGDGRQPRRVAGLALHGLHPPRRGPRQAAVHLLQRGPGEGLALPALPDRGALGPHRHGDPRLLRPVAA
jgi:signal peptidase I